MVLHNIDITRNVFRASSHTSIPLDSKTSTQPKYWQTKMFIFYYKNYYISILCKSINFDWISNLWSFLFVIKLICNHFNLIRKYTLYTYLYQYNSSNIYLNMEGTYSSSNFGFVHGPQMWFRIRMVAWWSGVIS